MNIEEMKNDLFYSPKHAAVVGGEDVVAKANAFAEGYKVFLNNAKTEREATAEVVKMAKKQNYSSYILSN